MTDESARVAKVLIVDDHGTNRLKLSMAVKHLGYTTDTANDGVHALNKLRVDAFDLVLLDIIMPNMDGHQVLAEMKADSNLRNIPVIVVSSLDEMDSVVTAIELGAEDYLSKDFEPTLLRARISACLEKKQLRDEVINQFEFIRSIFGKYVPESVARAIVEQEGNLEPERKTATIMYTDIAGFTATAESMQPEQVFKTLNEYFPAVIEPIARLGGVVNQFQGDAMLVTFNVPVADDKHADNAVRAARDIIKITGDRTFGGAVLQTRIGISTGDVVAGNVGSGERFNYTVHGDAVNLAARLEQLNKQYGTNILISERTVSLLEGQYDLLSIGETPIHGKENNVLVYSLSGIENAELETANNTIPSSPLLADEIIGDISAKRNPR